MMLDAAMRIRALAAGDLEAVAAIEAAASSQPWSRTLFEGELSLDDTQRLWLVGECDGRVRAFGGVMFVGTDVHVMNVAVEPRYRRRGFGRQILAELLERSVRLGGCHATLEVRESNDAAIELYRRFRLGPVGVRPDYYEDGEDALILWAHDIDRPSYLSLLARLKAPSP